MQLSEFKPYDQTTITGYITQGKLLKVSESAMSFKEVIDDEIVVQYHNIMTKYVDILRPYIMEFEMTDEELQRYKHQPALYCYEAYGTPELASSLMYINNMVSRADFKKKKIKTFTTNIMDIIKELMSLNERDLKNNRANAGLTE